MLVTAAWNSNCMRTKTATVSGTGTAAGVTAQRPVGRLLTLEGGVELESGLGLSDSDSTLNGSLGSSSGLVALSTHAGSKDLLFYIGLLYCLHFWKCNLRGVINQECESLHKI